MYSRACCSGVEVCKSQTFLCNLINVGCANLASKTAYVRETEIIGDDNEEVRAFSHGEMMFNREAKQLGNVKQLTLKGEKKKIHADTHTSVCSFISCRENPSKLHKPLFRADTRPQDRSTYPLDAPRPSQLWLHISCSAPINRLSAIGWIF